MTAGVHWSNDHGEFVRRRPILIANPGSDLYGSDRMLLETLSALVASGEHVVVTVPGPGPLIDEITARGGEVVMMKTPIVRKSALRPRGAAIFVGTTAAAFAPGLRLIRRLRPRVVIVNTITPPLWIALARLQGVPVVCHVHEGEASATTLIKKGLAAPLLFADRLIVNSRFSLKVLTDAYPSLERRATVVYNAVAGPPASDPPRPRIDGPVRLLQVGRVSPRKGTHVAIEAVRLLAERGVDARLDVLGSVFEGYEWFDRQLRETIRNHGLQNKINFLGFHSDVWPFLRQADICLVPSTVDEPFGNTAVEAALAGRPSIVSLTSGLVEATDGFASSIGVEPGPEGQELLAAEAIATAVEQIVSEWPNYARAAAEDAMTARSRYSTDRYAHEIVDTVARLDRTTAVPQQNGRSITTGAVEQVVIAVLTYRRPDELRALLPRLAHQAMDNSGVDRSVSIMVVDNSPDGDARALVAAAEEEFRGRARIRYRHEPRAGISAARNHALDAAADDDVLVFIDDDERPIDSWLSLLLDCRQRYAADLVQAPVRSEFDTTPEDWILSGGFFDRRRMPTGTLLDVAVTNNLLLDLRTVRRLGVRFDPDLGTTGGEDTLFTRRLHRAGATMVWCNEAFVIDVVPAERATRRWVTRRAISAGNSAALVDLKLDDSAGRRLATRIRLLTGGAARIAGGGVRVAIGRARNSPADHARGTRTILRGVGMSLGAWGFGFHEYARPGQRSVGRLSRPKAQADDGLHLREAIHGSDVRAERKRS